MGDDLNYLYSGAESVKQNSAEYEGDDGLDNYVADDRTTLQAARARALLESDDDDAPGVCEDDLLADLNSPTRNCPANGDLMVITNTQAKGYQRLSPVRPSTGAWLAFMLPLIFAPTPNAALPPTPLELTIVLSPSLTPPLPLLSSKPPPQQPPWPLTLGVFSPALVSPPPAGPKLTQTKRDLRASSALANKQLWLSDVRQPNPRPGGGNGHTAATERRAVYFFDVCFRVGL